ncbi:MAG: toll/interleukin-1 receptor domain-containing protein [Caenispirillum sp.]|nr:toll/interleukin-1 receptor domain-containing protein [Caenispirillum sp.]
MAGVADKQYDIFLSYARTPDAEAAATLKQALEAAGLSVWVDSEGIRDHEPITSRVVGALRNSRVLLAYYSGAYPTRRYCQWELTLAVLAAEREGRDAPSRALVISPDGDAERVHPTTLRGPLFRTWAPGEDTAALVEGVRQHLESVPGPMADIAPAAPRRWIGANPNRHLSDFVGRLPELWEVHGALAGEAVLLTGDARAPQGGEGTAQLQACGGMGKSMLAEEYARRFAQAYPGGIFWLSATGAADNWRPRLESQLLTVLTGLDPEADFAALLTMLKDLELDLRLAVVQSRVRARLDALDAAERPYLWVVDDLPQGTSAEALKHWLAPTDGGCTLVTTRDRGLTGVGRALLVRELDAWSAFALLTTYRKPEGEVETTAVREIVETLGCYPLGIAVAARLVDSYNSFAELLKIVDSPDADARVLAKDLEGELPNGHESNIVATLRLSFKRAEASGGAEALDPLRFAACMQPQHPVPIDFFVAAYTEHARADVERLDRLSLLDRSKGQATVHQIICRAITLDSSADAMIEARAKAVAVCTAAMSVAHDVTKQEALTRILPHVETLTTAVTTADEADLLSWLGRYHSEGGRAREAERAYRLAAETQAEHLGPEHPDTLTSMNNLASTLRAQGQHAEARALQQEVLLTRRRVLGVEHPDTLTSLNNLALTVQAQGRHAEAQALQQEVLSARRRVLGAEHPGTLTSLNNLALTLNAQGRHAEARVLQEEVLSVLRRGLGSEHPDTLTSMNNLALTLQAEGRYAEARSLEEEALSVRRRVVGPEHPDTLRSMNNLASTLLQQGQHAEARALQEESLSVRRRVLGSEHPETLTSMNNLASSLWELGDHAKARALDEEALSVRRRVLGPEHPHTLTSLNNLALTLWALGQHAEALALGEEALSVRRRVFGSKHPETLASMNNLAGMLWRQGDHAAHGRCSRMSCPRSGAHSARSTRTRSPWPQTLPSACCTLIQSRACRCSWRHWKRPSAPIPTCPRR